VGRVWLTIGFVCGVLVGAATYPVPAEEANEPSGAELMDALMWGRGTIGGPFELTDHTGQRRTDADFRGKLLLIYFGFTYCPDICPTDLLSISSAVDLLGSAGEAVQPLFITIDPERDTQDHLADYVTLFHPRLIGLTGPADQIRRVARGYKVYYAKVSIGRSEYTIDHTGFIYLVDADGNYLGFFPPGTSAQRLIEIIRPHLSMIPEK
jgi:cytochrome oxidase Cu insertion factor (SCO1/SenC/PrrC family)